MFSQEKADAICARLAEGESLRAICETEGMPAESTVRAWALDNVEGFSAQYARAREIGYERHADQIIELADQSRVGVKRTTRADGAVELVEGDMVERSRLQVDARKWILAKMLPKRFGDKVDLHHSGAVQFQKIECVVVDPAV
jgi:hypothetical protein